MTCADRSVRVADHRSCDHKPAIDGVGHIVCAQSSSLVWGLVGVTTSAPRLLGVMAAPSVGFATTPMWRVDLDTTKQLSAGSLLIETAEGTVVRTLATPESVDGSIRGVTWDGLDSSGTPVPTGTYGYVLAADAVDGSGAVGAVDGLTDPSGAVVVASEAVQPQDPLWRS